MRKFGVTFTAVENFNFTEMNEFLWIKNTIDYLTWGETFVQKAVRPKTSFPGTIRETVCFFVMERVLFYKKKKKFTQLRWSHQFWWETYEYFFFSAVSSLFSMATFVYFWVFVWHTDTVFYITGTVLISDERSKFLAFDICFRTGGTNMMWACVHQIIIICVCVYERSIRICIQFQNDIAAHKYNGMGYERMALAWRIHILLLILSILFSLHFHAETNDFFSCVHSPTLKLVRILFMN